MNDNKILLIDSTNRFNGTPESFSINLPYSVFGRRIPKTIKIIDINLPFTWYRITASNNSFTFDEGGGAISVALPIQNYDTFTMQSTLQNSLNAAGANTYTVDFDTATQKYTITSTGAFSLDFSGVNTAGPLLGWGTTITASALSQTAPNIINFYMDKYVYICSNLGLGIDQGVVILQSASDPNPNDCLYAVPINVDFGFMIHQKDTDLPNINIEHTVLGNRNGGNGPRNLTFRLELPSGNPINLNGHNWAMRVLLSFQDDDSARITLPTTKG